MSQDKMHDDKLKDRHLSEEQFSNSMYSNKCSSPEHYRYSPTAIIYSKMKKKLGDIKGKRVLEYGCGTGWITYDLASMGGIIDSFDISQVAVDKVDQLLKEHNLDRNCNIKKMAAEDLNYPDNYFDIVFGFAILHHLDLDKAIPELHRVMKPSGRAYFAEPLGNNPIINLYRKFTPQYRTIDESPIKLKEFSEHTNLFSEFFHEEVYLTALVPSLLVYLPCFGRFFNRLVNPLMKLDEFLLKHSPELGKWAWYSIFSFHKKSSI